MQKKFDDDAGLATKYEDLPNKIKSYKQVILSTISHDLSFIKINRYIYLYGFTVILISLIIITMLIIVGEIELGDGISSQFLFPLISGIFVQLIALMIIVFKYLFDPIREVMKHSMNLITDEKTPSMDAKPILSDSDSDYSPSNKESVK